MTEGVFRTPWGPLVVCIGDAGLCGVRFDAETPESLAGPWAEALARYVGGQPIPADLPVDLSGLLPFSRRVLEACRRIPFGTVTTYAQLAASVGCRSARAVGQALARNPAPLVIPCHRVVGGDGRLTGYLGGLAWKAALLRHEGLSLAEDGTLNPAALEVNR